MRRLLPELVAAEQRWRDADKAVADHLATVAARNAAARARRATAADRALAARLREIRKAAYGEYEEARSAAHADPAVEAELAQIESAAHAAILAARAARGCAWGTGGMVEQAADAARKVVRPAERPSFSDRDGRRLGPGPISSLTT